MELLNTLYVMTPRAYVRLDHETVRVDVEGKTTLRLPLIHLDGITCFGDVLVSPALIHSCGEQGRSIVWLDRNGRFKGRLNGPASGNVLLRRSQHEVLSDPAASTAVATSFAAGKIHNTRQVMLRAGRDAANESDAESLRGGAALLADELQRLRQATGIDEVRGREGDSARVYFERFEHMVRADRTVFGFSVRTRRPPRDPLNAVLSFIYALVLSDCTSSLEGVGLDPQVGYLHVLRPGRPALALDMMEELRPAVADRLTLALVNRRQLAPRDFVVHPGGAVLLTDKGRKTVITEYQKRKQEQVRHQALDRLVPLGLVPHLQARLLARCIRGDVEHYLPFLIH